MDPSKDFKGLFWLCTTLFASCKFLLRILDFLLILSCVWEGGTKGGLWTQDLFYMHNGYFHLIVRIKSILCT